MSTEDSELALDELVESYTALLAAGQAPSVEAFVREHAQHADALRSVLPVLRQMHDVRQQVEAETQPPRTSERVPGRVGPYRILEQIGRGGMGRVFLASEAGGAPVALKLVHDHLVGDASFVKRFLREADIGRGIDHPNVVRTLNAGGTGQDGDPPYLVMEYVEGQDLRALLREVTDVSERLAYVVALAMADGLGAIHTAGILHRDVKPENVIITHGESVKLMDLGVARLMEERERLSGTGEFVGSLLYAAPEQLAGAPLDARTDLFALGLVLFELVVGRHPREVVRRGAAALGLPRARQAGARVSSFFDAVIATLLAPRPAQRFASASELAQVLREGERSSWWRARKHDQERSARRRLNAAFAPTSFRGRDDVLGCLADRFADVATGSGQVVLLEGDAGIGKSRIVAEWLDALESQRLARHVLVVPHAPGSGEASIAPLAAALYDACEDPAEASSTWVGPALQHLGGEVGSGPISHFAVGAAYARVLRELSAEGPVVLVIEDLHLSSEETRAVFVAVARSIRADPILLVGTSRPNPAPPWPPDLREASHATRIALEPLDSECCAQLVLELTASHAPADSRVRALAQRSDGNPLFLLELAREQIRSDTDAHDVPIPASIREMLEQRLERLEASSRELLEAAACLGHVFDPAIAARAAGLPVIEALKRFGRIERATGLVVAQGLDYRFQHHVVRDSFYEGVHGRLRASYHTAIADALEQSARAQSPDELPPTTRVTLARQFLESEAPHRALPYLRPAADHLFQANERLACHRLIHRALSIEGLLTGGARAYALCRAATSQTTVAAPDELRPSLEEALTLAQADSDDELSVEILRTLAHGHTQRGDFRAAIARIEESLPLIDRMDAPSTEVSSLLILGGSLTILKRHEEARPVLERAFALCNEHGIRKWIGEATVRLSLLECEVGRHAEAMAHLEHSLSVSRDRGDREGEAAALSGMAHVEMVRGRNPNAAEHAQAALEIYFASGNSRNIAIWSHMLMIFLIQVGSFERAEGVGMRAIRWAQRFGDREAAAFLRKQLGWISLAQGRHQEACDALREAMAVGEELENARLTEQSRSRLADCYLAVGAFDLVAQCLQPAAGALTDAQDDVEPLRLRSNYARLHEARGEFARARVLYESLLAPDVDQARFGGRPTNLLALARCALALGDTAAAESAAQEGLAEGRLDSSPTLEAWGLVLLATVDGVDEAAAFLSQAQERIPVCERIALFARLYEVSHDAEHLQAAHDARALLAAHTSDEHQADLARRFNLPDTE